MRDKGDVLMRCGPTQVLTSSGGVMRGGCGVVGKVVGLLRCIGEPGRQGSSRDLTRRLGICSGH